MSTGTLILDELQVEQKIQRMVHEIHENYFDSKTLAIVGVEGNGSYLASYITKELSKVSDLNLIECSIKLDKKSPLKSPIELSGELKDINVLLVDDVLNTGRTLMYAAGELTKKPIKSLATVILVNRKHHKFPIHADFVGLSLATTLKEHIAVEFKNGKGKVFLQ